jgi:hypothetical protein
VTVERALRADPGLTLFPFILSSATLSRYLSVIKPLLSDACRVASRTARKPSRLTLGVAAAIAATLVGVLAAVSPSGSASGNMADVGSAGHVRPTAMFGVGGHAPQAARGIAARQSGRGVEVQRSGGQDGRQAPAQHKAARHAPAQPKPAAHKAVAHKAVAHKAVAAKPVAYKPAVHKKKAAHKAVTRKKTARRAAVARKPYLIYDSVTPSAVPGSRRIAAYATGNYAASSRQVSGHGPVLWIDTTGSDYAASALDVEPGDATPTLAANWARHRLAEHPHSQAVIYTMRSEWGAVKAAVDALPARMRSEVRWWIADPTGSPHIVPGANATQWYWGPNYDITTVAAGF